MNIFHSFDGYNVSFIPAEHGVSMEGCFAGEWMNRNPEVSQVTDTAAKEKDAYINIDLSEKILYIRSESYED